MVRSSNYRLYFLIFFIFFLVSGIAARLFSLQILNHNFYKALAQDQHQFFEKLVPSRGRIFLQDKSAMLYPLAINKDYLMVYAVPREIQNPKEVAECLSDILQMQKEELFNILNQPDDPYEPLKGEISQKVVEEISALNLTGIYLGYQPGRWYPQESLASHVLGFVGYQGEEKIGQYGLEGYYEEELVGQPGVLESQRDAFGRWIWSSNQNFQPAQDGDDLILTIDQNIQFTAQQKLKEVMDKWQAESGSVIIMEPATGAILAMASLPDFNPNQYNKVEDINVFLNPAAQKIFEPGSIFKPITMAAGLDTGRITPQTSYIDEGSVRVGGYVITNAAGRTYGLSSMKKVLEKSINTGAVFAQRQVGGEFFRKYVEAFGFERPTGIDLAGEIGGSINNLRPGNPEINFATASFGQGIAVTPIEIVTAIGAIANEGKLMRPYLVSKILKPDGQEIVIKPELVRQVVTSKTADTLTAMLVETAREGYDKVKIKDYFVAAKTGTAQIPNSEGRGYSDETIHSFIGYAPAFNPKFLIFFKIDRPKGIRFASDSLSGVFTEMTRYLLNYYEIPPEE